MMNNQISKRQYFATKPYWADKLFYFSNIIGLIVFARKSIDKKIKTKPIYQTILFIDSVYLFSQIFQDTFDSLNIKLSLMSIYVGIGIFQLDLHPYGI